VLRVTTIDLIDQRRKCRRLALNRSAHRSGRVPYGRRLRARTLVGRFNSPRRGGFAARARIVAAGRPLSWCRLIRNRPTPETRSAPSAYPSFRYFSAACADNTASTAFQSPVPSRGSPSRRCTMPVNRIAGG
jgi:hypothetical protein